MGLAVVAIAGAMGASVRHSAYTSARARTEAEARRLAEWERTSGAMADCNLDPTAFYQAALDEQKSTGFTVSILSVEGYQAGGYTNIDGGCGPGEYDVQRITFRVAANSTDGQVDMTIVKREA